MMNEDFMKTDARLDRIEEKINYMLALIEELFAEYDDKDEDEDDSEEYSGNEGWIAGLDAWKKDYDADEEEI